jgi:hypothetical protein
MTVPWVRPSVYSIGASEAETTRLITTLIETHRQQAFTWTEQELVMCEALPDGLVAELERMSVESCADVLAALERAIRDREGVLPLGQLGRLAQAVNARLMFGAL